MNRQQSAIQRINAYVAKDIPFVFIIDFEMKSPIILPINELESHDIYFNINGKTNYHKTTPIFQKEIFIKKEPVAYPVYKKAFDIVLNNLKAGNSYLTNLTLPTPIDLNASLLNIFEQSKAKYKLLFKNEFLVFSPECFIKIDNDKIYSFPMKGTIDANLPNAREVLLQNEKEKAEHSTIVDLIRNDLGIVARKIRVEKFRYLDRINTSEKDLLQVSSVISGELPIDFQNNLGELIFKLLPAGSISGAPKKKTVDIIKEAEDYERGYYTGIFGYYENGKLDSGVMIRFIERQKDRFVYKSGGGITAYSDPKEEYQELIDKVYVPN